MARETQYTANTGWATVSTANSNLDGSGTLGTVLTAASNGTLIKSVIIKAITSTSKGMVRLFVDDGTNKRLIKEVEVPAITKAAINPAFEIKLPMDFVLQSGCILKASTQVADSFNVIAEGMDWTYYSSSVRTDTTQYTTNTGTNIISTANSNLDGTGTIIDIYVTGSSGTYKGSSVRTITIKGTANPTTPGMIRLYLNDNAGTKKLFSEVFVPAIAQAGTAQDFEYTFDFENDFDIKSGWSLAASTENAQTFHCTVEGNDWKYLS